MTSHPWREDVDSRTNDYVRRAMRHFPRLRETYLESWAESARSALVPSFLRPLSPSERDLLIDEHWRREHAEPSWNPREFDRLVEDIERLVLRTQTLSPIGASFVRLGSCAPLDSPMARGGDFQVDGGPEALDVMLESERIFDDLCLAQECDYAPTLVVRPWLELAPEHELRAEIRQGQLVGLEHRPQIQPLSLIQTRDPTPAQRRAIEARLPLVRELFGTGDLWVDFVANHEEAALLDAQPLLRLRREELANSRD